MSAAVDPARRVGRAGGNDATDRLFRFVAWGNIYFLAVYVAEAFLVIIAGLPGPDKLMSGDGGAIGWVMLAPFPLALVAAGIHVKNTPLIGLREDCDRLSGINQVILRGCFYVVFFVGLADAVISFLRVEEMLPALVGDDLTAKLGLPAWRGSYIHMPIAAISFVWGMTRKGTLGFPWLALMIVSAELLIVLTRFVFFYEQAFMSDLVRFWYAALFLLASAYTLSEEGHVRVDVFYANFSLRKRGLVNATGSMALGMVLCWVILAIGLGSKSSVISAPLIGFEISQNTVGMYIKYLMAGFLGIFAATMLIQFCAMLLDAVADRRGDPGHRELEGASVT